MTHNFKRTCPECSTAFSTPMVRKLFCTTACQKAWGNRDLTEGMGLVGLAKAWRLGRNTSDPKAKAAAKDAFNVLCRRLDESSKADREAGRTDALTMLRRRVAHGLVDLA